MTTTTTVRDRLRSALRDAMRARDAVALSAVRSALAAIDNAEAVDVATLVRAVPAVMHASVAGTVVGVGAAELPRRVLTTGDLDALVRREVDDRSRVAAELEAAGRPDRAERLRAEAVVLVRCLTPDE
jgi:uncharacterized protein YqeY